MTKEYSCVECHRSWLLDCVYCPQQQIAMVNDVDYFHVKKHPIEYKILLNMKNKKGLIPARLEGHCYCGAPFPVLAQSVPS
jgi:hypothetical protein